MAREMIKKQGGYSMKRSLEKIFNPRSVAVIGASEIPGKASERRTRSLIQGGYKGNIYLINPKQEIIDGVNYQKAKNDLVFARFGDSWKWTSELTPGEENVLSGESTEED